MSKHHAILKDGKLYWIDWMPTKPMWEPGKNLARRQYERELKATIDSAILFEDQKKAIRAVEFNKEISVVQGKPVVILQENQVYSFEWPGTVEKAKIASVESGIAQYKYVARLIAPKEITKAERLNELWNHNSAHSYTEGSEPLTPPIMKTDDELIAEFMRLKSFEDSRYGKLWPDPLGSTQSQFGLKYSTSWDWLMPVVEKIETLGHEVDIYKNCCEISGEDMIRWEGSDKHLSTYSAVIEFIKWHNNQPKP